MSRFFKGAMDSDSDSGSESSSSDDEPQQRRHQPVNTHDFAFPSDDEVEERRVVRARKDRKYDELKDLIKKTRNARNVKDFSKLAEAFEDLCKAFEKTKPVLKRQNLSTPRFYVRYLADLEDFIKEAWEDKEGRKTLSKPNAQGLARLRQRVRKYTEEFKSQLATYRESPDPAGYDTPEEIPIADDDDDISEVDGPVTAVSSARHAERSDDDSEWGSDSTDTSESEIDLSEKKLEELRRYFLKKEFRDDLPKDSAKTGKVLRRDERIRRDERREERIAGIISDEDGGDWTEVGKKEEKIVLFEPKQEITLEVFIEKFDGIMAGRGRKTTNRKQHVRILQELLAIAEDKKFNDGLIVKLYFSIVSAYFELSLSVSDCMEFSAWNKALTTVNDLLDLLISTGVRMSISVSEEAENVSDIEKPFEVHGSVLMIVQRLDNELTKILQNADCHSTDYIEKLKGEKDICALIEKTHKFVDDRLDNGLFEKDEVCKMYMLRIDHMYYKYEDTIEMEDKSLKPSELIDKLCKRIYKLDDEKRLRQRAILCHVYFLALHDYWHQARDLLLMSHLQAIVDHSDVPTQILYNRTICQLGLCAFRHGFIKEAQQSLSEIMSTQRSKELLAQGMTLRQYDRTIEQEKQERARQVPYHMHINIELMECVYLICSMLVEIPLMASHEFDLRKRLLSRTFHYQLKQSEKMSLVGPPENTREHVVAASRAMLAGDWQKCRDFIVNEKMNTKVWNMFRSSEKVKTMVIQRIQEESLRTYLLMYSTVYTTVSLTKLAALFELDIKQVHAIITKMILTEELAATLDEPSGCVMMHRVEPSRLQVLALHLTEKLHQLAESNEQIMDPRSAGNRGYTGQGAWLSGRNDRNDDKKKSVSFQGNRGNDTRSKGGNAWGTGAGGQQRRRAGDNAGGRRF